MKRDLAGWVLSTPATASQPVTAQVQPKTAGDLQHTDGLNVEGVHRAVYLYGDVLQFPRVTGGPVYDWKVVSMVETWPLATPPWAKVIVVLQLR